jgi:hypothetical protein
VEPVEASVLKSAAVRWAAWVLSSCLLLTGLVGCNGGSCPAVRSAILGLDAGQVRCDRAENCPRSSNAAICTETGEPNLPTQSCVRCEATLCWLYACSG